MDERLLTDEEIFEARMYGQKPPDLSPYIAVANAQLAKDLKTEQARVERILEIITKDFVEVVANSYVDDKYKRHFFDLWRGLRWQALRASKKRTSQREEKRSENHGC